jgi:SAM-dependent methyltransferase
MRESPDEPADTVTAVTARYDRDARLYERYWAPVLAPAAARLLDRCDAWVRTIEPPLRVLDLGTGTGALAIDAADRWPDARIIGLDGSDGMLSVARGRAGDRRIEWVRAEADRMPVADVSVDLVVSSFVLQLVPDRAAALVEIRRVLRPGGRLAFVTWLQGRDVFPPADEFDEAVVDLDIREESYEEEVRAGDLRSPRSAADELRRAGFRRVRADRDHLDQRWTAETYLEYKVAYDELGLFEELDEVTAGRLEARARERLAALRPVDFRWRPPICYVSAERP